MQPIPGVDLSKCIHGKPMTDVCFKCFDNAEDMKRDLLAWVAAQERLRAEQSSQSA